MPYRGLQTNDRSSSRRPTFIERSYDGYWGNAAIFWHDRRDGCRNDDARLRTEQGSCEHGDRSEQHHLRTKHDGPRRRRTRSPLGLTGSTGSSRPSAS
jgi:hypothetical protein